MADVLRSGEIERAERKAAELNVPAELAPAEVSPETGAPAEPELLLRVTRIRSALADLQAPKREQATLFSILFVLASQLFLWWPLFFHVPGIDLYRLYEAGVNILRSSSAYDNYDWLDLLPALLLMTPVLLSFFLGAIAYGVLDPQYAQQIRASAVALDFVHGRLDVNAVVRAAHSRFARWHRLQSAHYVDEEVGLLFREADWFLAPRRNFWRLAWLSTPAAQFFWGGVALLIIASVIVLSWPALGAALDAHPRLNRALEVLFLALPSTGLLLMAITYPSQLWRDLHWRAWHAPLRKALMAELERIDPQEPRPPQPHEVHTLATMLGLRKPEIVDPNVPREESEEAPQQEGRRNTLAQRLVLGPVSGVGANPAVPWATWSVLNAFWLLISSAMTLPQVSPVSPPLNGPGPLLALIAGTLTFVGLPLGLTIADALMELLALRRLLPGAAVELRLVSALDKLQNSERRRSSGGLVRLSGDGSVEEALHQVARELEAELKARPHPRLPLPAAVTCLLISGASLIFSVSILDFAYAELAAWFACLALTAASLSLVPWEYRRRMILDELTEYMQHSLAWDGEESAADM